MILSAVPAEEETALDSGPVIAGSADSAPLVLKFGVSDVYCRKTACDCIAEIARRSYEGLLAALAKEHHITLEFTYFEEVMDLEKAVRARKFDGVICKPWTALRLRAGTWKRVADVCDPDNRVMMTGLFLVPKESALRKLEDLQGRRVAFGQPDSYEKHQAPLLQLAARGIRPATGVYYSSCGENLDALMSGKVDAAVISSYALTASCAVDFAKPEDFRTLAATVPMPLTSVLVDLEKVGASAAARLQQALLALSGKRVPADLTGGGFVAPVSWKPVSVDPGLVPPQPAPLESS